MAREPSDVDDERSLIDRPRDSDATGNNVLLGRRTYLTTALTATATAGALSGVISASEDFEVIEANNSQYHLDDGEVFENKVIDFSNGNWYTIIASATDWEIRNVGFRGVHDHDHNAIVVADRNRGHSVVENVYLGDGCIRPAVYSSHGQCGIFVHRNHSGHIDFRNVYAEDWPNNGIYGSAAAYDDPGTIRIENCFAKNNYVANFRCSDGSTVIDSVAYNDGNGRYTGRPFWGWGNQEVINCKLHAGPYSNGNAIWGRDGSRTYVENTEHTGYGMSGSGSYNEGPGVSITSNIDLSIPDGVPTSVEAAASGDIAVSDSGGEDGTTTTTASGNGTIEDLQYLYELDNTAADSPTEYFIEVEDGGDLTPSEYDEATVDDGYQWISPDGNRAAGMMAGGDRHAWEFDTLLLDVDVRGDADAYVNGNESVLDRYPLEGASGDDWKVEMPWHETTTTDSNHSEDQETLPHVIVVDGTKTTDPSTYALQVSGQIVEAPNLGPSYDPSAVIEGGIVRGIVDDWFNTYLFDGTVRSVTVRGDAEVHVSKNVYE